jgi:hypothetical protein
MLFEQLTSDNSPLNVGKDKCKKSLFIIFIFYFSVIYEISSDGHHWVKSIKIHQKGDILLCSTPS